MKHKNSVQDMLRFSMEKVLGPSIEGYPEPTYPCPFCKTRGFAEFPGHIHISYRKEKALCHRCDFSSRNLFGLLKRLDHGITKAMLGLAGDTSLTFAVQTMLTPVQEEREIDSEDDEDQQESIELPEGYIRILSKKRGMMGDLCLEYLIGRGVTSVKQIKQLKIGYSAIGRFSGMLIFPTFVNDELVFVTSRRVAPGDGPKVLHIARDRLSLIYNIDAAQDADTIIVSEGVFDALSWKPDETGVGVATFGKSLSDQQADVLASIAPKEICVCYDADAHNATIKAAELLSSKVDEDRTQVSVILLRDGDPNSERKKLKKYFSRRKLFTLELQTAFLLNSPNFLS